MKCLYCHKELTKSQLKEKNKYCSKECASSARKNPTRFCLQCGKVCNKGCKFCSKSCSNRFNPRRSLLNTCKGCGTSCSVTKTYCTLECYNLNRPKNLKTGIVTPKESVKNYIQRKKVKMVEYLGGCCMFCGYSKCIAALDFHHKDPATKLFTLSSNSFSFERCKPELDKCYLLCANCHRELHWNEQN